MSALTSNQSRYASLGITAVSVALTIAGQRYGAAELPHTLACLTVALPLAGLGWMLRSQIPAVAAFVLVAFIQWTA